MVILPLVVFMVMTPGFKLIEMGGDANVFTFLAFLLCVGSASLQLVADHQIHRFIKEKRGRVCNVGLWKHGRHPNYLGEITEWFGFAIMTWSAAGALFWWFSCCNLVPRANAIYNRYAVEFAVAYA